MCPRDSEKRQEYKAQFYREHREELLAYNRAWIAAHPERRRAIALKSYHKRKGEKS